MIELKEKETQLDEDLRSCVEWRFKEADLMRFSFADEVIDMLTEISDEYGGEIDAIDEMRRNGVDGYFIQFTFEDDALDFYREHAVDIERFLNECEDEYCMPFTIKRPHYQGAVYLVLKLIISKLYLQLEEEECFE